VPSALSHRRALITGSVQGIGLATAQALASAGASVMLTDIVASPDVQEIVRAVGHHGHGEVAFHAADLTVEEEIGKLVTWMAERLGPPDILVNNAAVRTRKSIETIAATDWHRAIAVNMTAPFHLIRAVLPFMRRQNWGRIINISSGFGLIGSPNRIDYVTTKTALVGMTKAIALDLADSGITCNAVCPGSTWTPRQENRLNRIIAEEGLAREEAYERLLKSLRVCPGTLSWVA